MTHSVKRLKTVILTAAIILAAIPVIAGNGPGNGSGNNGNGSGDGTANGGSSPRDGSGNGIRTGDCINV